jgi:hypothetical protein
MDMMGMSEQGMHLLGFDNRTQEYISLWADSWSTWWKTSKGNETEKGVIETKGMMNDARDKLRPSPARQSHGARGRPKDRSWEEIQHERLEQGRPAPPGPPRTRSAAPQAEMRGARMMAGGPAGWAWQTWAPTIEVRRRQRKLHAPVSEGDRPCSLLQT